MLKINWKVRLKNPVFLASLAAAIITPIFTAMGVNWSEINTWSDLWHIFLDVLNNPVLLVSIAVSVYNLIIDPTTAGISDSTQALTYDKPKSSK